MKTEGSIRSQGLPQLLLDLGSESSTGILTIQGRDDIIAFALLEGRVVSADALNQTMEDGLGQVLTEEGLCPADDFAQLASEYQSGGGQVVDLLVERGFVDRGQLLGAVRTHTFKLCCRALGWTEGEYKFYRGDEVSYEEGVAPISPEELLIRAGRALDLELMPGGAPGDDDIFRRTRGRARDAEVADGPDDLDETAFAAFKLLDGKRSIAELAEESGVTPGRVAYLILRWQKTGMVEKVGRRRPQRTSALKSPTPTDAAKPTGAPRESRLKKWLAAGKSAASRKAAAGGTSLWPARGLAFVLLVSIAVSFQAEPSRLLLPFPWQRGLQESLERERTSALLSVLRRANGVHYLVHGRYAEGLPDLAVAGLMSSADLEDETGRPLAYSTGDASYAVRSSGVADAERTALLQETIRGNFLLDPELALPAESRRPLLVLLE